MTQRTVRRLIIAFLIFVLIYTAYSYFLFTGPHMSMNMS